MWLPEAKDYRHLTPFSLFVSFRSFVRVGFLGIQIAFPCRRSRPSSSNSPPVPTTASTLLPTFPPRPRRLCRRGCSSGSGKLTTRGNGCRSLRRGWRSARRRGRRWVARFRSAPRLSTMPYPPSVFRWGSSSTKELSKLTWNLAFSWCEPDQTRRRRIVRRPLGSGPTCPPRWEISLRRGGFLFGDEQGRQGKG